MTEHVYWEYIYICTCTIPREKITDALVWNPGTEDDGDTSDGCVETKH